MANFEGKNGENVKKSFFERLKYDVRAFPLKDGEYPKAIKDFHFAETILYGRINKLHDVIYLNTYNLKEIKSKNEPSKSIKAVNFVSDAFSGVVADFEKAILSGKIEKDPYLYKIKAYSGFLDPRNSYRRYSENINNIFINTYLSKDRRKVIESFSSFYEFYSSYLLEISNTLPVSFASFLSSGFCGPLNTGLAIHVSDLDASDDEKKESFINSNNFEFYKLVAEKHGFSINKNAPWILIADIASPSMLRYSSRYGASSEDAILNGYYLKAFSGGIGDLRRAALRTYDRFITQQPKNITNDGFVRRSVCRQPISIDQYNSGYPDTKWVDIYIDIRYSEQRKPLSAARLQQVKRDAKSIQAADGTANMELYVNSLMRSFDNYNGSYSKKFGKRNLIKTGTKTQPTY